MLIKISKPNLLLKTKLVANKITITSFAKMFAINKSVASAIISGNALPNKQLRHEIEYSIDIPAIVWNTPTLLSLSVREAFYYVYLSREMTPERLGVTSGNILRFVRNGSKYHSEILRAAEKLLEGEECK